MYVLIGCILDVSNNLAWLLLKENSANTNALNIRTLVCDLLKHKLIHGIKRNSFI